jgi:hypothetical protein
VSKALPFLKIGVTKHTFSTAGSVPWLNAKLKMSVMRGISKLVEWETLDAEDGLAYFKSSAGNPMTPGERPLAKHWRLSSISSFEKGAKSSWG